HPGLRRFRPPPGQGRRLMIDVSPAFHSRHFRRSLLSAGGDGGCQYTRTFGEPTWLDCSIPVQSEAFAICCCSPNRPARSPAYWASTRPLKPGSQHRRLPSPRLLTVLAPDLPLLLP